MSVIHVYTHTHAFWYIRVVSTDVISYTYVGGLQVANFASVLPLRSRDGAVGECTLRMQQQHEVCHIIGVYE